eukprot:TRINITY_DN9156_c0_g2_i1.p2 TRINITY_DN9156_c0_g2~~TRINITY_DN9156_c0_g2_i1.p2  ORF type:complete len:217 (-),score=40.86 TRINITY_DN9156_c0_g2_i1:399-1049(-)
MEQMMKQFWQDMKGKGKGKGNKDKQSKRRKKSGLNPWQRLILASSKLSLSEARSKRQLRSDLVHVAMFPNPYPEEIKEAVEMTTATKGTDRRPAAKATWMAVHKGLLSTKRKLPKEVIEVIQKHFDDAKGSKFLEEKILECPAAITFDQSMMLFTWWVRNLDEVEMALLEAIVQLGADVKHTPAPPYGLERDTSEALAEVLALIKSGQAGSSTDVW